MVEELLALEPYGLQWEAPVFREQGYVRQCRPVGDGRHLKLLINLQGKEYDAIWFGAVENGQCTIAVGDSVLFSYELEVNVFRDEATLQLKIRHAMVT